jgi:hypothetical protein
MFIVHFLFLYKENEPAVKRRKKMQPITRRVIKSHRWSDYVGLPCVYTPLRGAALKERALPLKRGRCETRRFSAAQTVLSL